MWFHRYKDGKDIEGRCKLIQSNHGSGSGLIFLVDYNSWIESDKALRLASKLPKDAIIVEGLV